MVNQWCLLLLIPLVVASCIRPIQPSATVEASPTVSLAVATVSAIQWTPGATMPTPRAELSAAEYLGKIYVPGGWTNGFGQSTAFEVYDPQTDQWQALADLPVHLNHHVTVALAQAIYVIGIEGAFRYQISTDSWSTFTPPPDLRWAGAAVAVDDALYLVGGDSLDQDLLRYRPLEDRWDRLAPLPAPGEHLAAAVIDGQIYVIGGRWGEIASTRVDRYDIAADQWSNVAPLHQARSGFGAAVVNNQIVVAGGELLDPLRSLRSAEVYDPLRDQWMLLDESLPSGVHGHALVAVDDELYLIGGSSQAGAVANTRKTLWGVLKRE